MGGARLRLYRNWEVARLCRESPKGVDYVRLRDDGLSGLVTLFRLTGDAARRAPLARSALFNLLGRLMVRAVPICARALKGSVMRLRGIDRSPASPAAKRGRTGERSEP